MWVCVFALMPHRVVLQAAALVAHRNIHNRTALFLAAGANNLVVVKLLVEAGAGDSYVV